MMNELGINPKQEQSYFEPKVRETGSVPLETVNYLMNFEKTVGKYLPIKNAVFVANTYFPMQEKYGMSNEKMQPEFVEQMALIGMTEEKAVPLFRDLLLSRWDTNPYKNKETQVMRPVQNTDIDP